MFSLKPESIKSAEIIKKAICYLVMVLPIILLFGIHVVFIKHGNVGLLTLPQIYGWSLALFTAAYFIIDKHVAVSLGRSFRYTAFFIVMLVYALISLIWAMHKDASFEAFIYQFCGVFTAIYIAAVVRNFNDLKIFLRVLSVCYIAVIIFGLIEIYTGRYFFSPSPVVYKYKDSYGLNYPCAVFYNTNDYASFITMFGPFAVFTLTQWVGGKTGKASGTLLSAAAFFSLLCSRARNCFITIIIFILVLLAICLLKKDYKKYAFSVSLVLASFLLSAVFLNITANTNESIIGKVGSITSSDHSIGMRLQMTIGGLKMAAAYHFMGVGVGNSVPLMPYYSNLRAINLHDMPLQILVEYGIIIFAFYTIMTILLARDFIKYRTADKNIQFFALICFLTLLAFQVVGLESSDAMHIPALWMLFGIWLACVKTFYKGNDNAIKKHLIFLEKYKKYFDI